MKILILSITTGGGHNACARALMDEVQALGADAMMADAYLTVSRPLYWLLDRVYRLCGGVFHRAYGAFYRYAERQMGNKFNAAVSSCKYRLRTRNLWKLIRQEQPDCIVFTHVFAGQLLEAMRKQGKLNVPSVGIVTDFTIHPNWERLTKTAGIILPHEDMREAAKLRGYTDKQIFVLGIPIHPRFEGRTDKAEARQLLHLPQDKKIVLVMCGSMGYGNPEKLVKQMDKSKEDFHFVAVCGQSKATKKRMNKLVLQHSITVYGYTDRVLELMDASDILVSKPGGLSTSEALTRPLPMLIVNPIPGHEVRNTEFLCAHGAATYIKDYKDPEEAINRYLKDEEFCKNLRENAKKLARPKAVKDIAELAVSIAKENKK